MLERFLTDTLTNAVILDDPRVLFAPTAQLFEDGRSVRTLLHERTHHASFDGAFGLALAGLNAMAALDAATIDHSVFNLSQRDYLLLRATYALFEPLIEGLALFAEFDAIPGSSPVASGIANTAARLILREPTYERLSSFLWTQRALSENVGAKADVLSLPIQRRPQYLLGYLAVKRLYFSLRHKCPALVEDSDLFVLLMLDYWFHDPPLAERLLRFDIPNPAQLWEDLAWVVRHFEERLDDLYANVDKHVGELTRYLLPGGIGITPIAGSGGPEYRGTAAPEFVEHANIRCAYLSAWVTPAALLNYRTDFRFASIAVEIKTTGREARVTSVAGELVFENIPIVQNSQTGEFIGSLDVVWTPNVGDIAATIISGSDGIVAVRQLDKETWNPPVLVEYFDEFPSAIEIQKVRHHLNDAQNKTAMLPMVREYEPAMSALARTAIEGIYSRMAVPAFEQPKPFFAGLSVDGFAAPLGERRLFERLCEVSARAGCHGWRFRAEAKANGWDIKSLLSDAEAINSRLSPILGREAIVVAEEFIACTV